MQALLAMLLSRVVAAPVVHIIRSFLVVLVATMILPMLLVLLLLTRTPVLGVLVVHQLFPLV